MNRLSHPQPRHLPLWEDGATLDVVSSPQHRCRAATVSFPEAFKHGSNATGDAAVTLLCDTPLSKKSLPALVCPYTLPNKVVVQRQPREKP